MPKRGKKDMDLSIIIPVFNSAQYIEQLIRIILKQIACQESKVEIIIVNDGSTDDTREKLKQLKRENVIAINLESNSGVSSARNAGIVIAKGDYVAFFDVDDLPTENYIFYICEAIKTRRKLYTFAYLINGRYVGRKNSGIQGYLQHHYFCTNTIIICRSLLIANKFREAYRFGEDQDLWVRLLSIELDVYSPKPLCDYRFQHKIHKFERHPFEDSMQEGWFDENTRLEIKKYIKSRRLLIQSMCSRKVAIKNIFSRGIPFNTRVKLGVAIFGENFYNRVSQIKWFI
jgi:glycosyltransferase involved in cell wall biosynthesis